MHPEWHTPVEMTQLCLVSTTLGAQVLILSEFITFTHNISQIQNTECVWAKHGPRFGQSMDIRRVLSSCHGCMCIIDGLSEPITFNIQVLITHLIIVISLSHTHTCIQQLKDYNFGIKNFALAWDPNKYNFNYIFHYVIKLFKY